MLLLFLHSSSGGSMSDSIEAFELTLSPVPPDTLSTVRQELMPLIESALADAGRRALLSDGEIRVEMEETFPVGEVVVVLVTLGSGIALETYKQVVLPLLRRRYGLDAKPVKNAKPMKKNR
jgi:hypothetical protein